MHRPIAVATFIVSLVIPLFSAAYAQSCPPPNPPTITLQNAEICAFATDQASATAGLASYSWSITHGSVTASDSNGHVTFSSDGSGDVVLTVNVTDGGGCPSSNSVTIPLHSISSPTITAPLELCPWGSGDLSVSAPAGGGAWQYVNWNVTNGYFQSDTYPYQTSYASGPNVRVYSNGQGPISVQVYVTDNEGCNATATSTIGVRSIQPPAITAPLEICPWSSGDLSVSPPVEGGAWQYVNWNVTNGYFQSDTYPYQTSYASGPNVRVYSNGQGPTSLQVYVTDIQGCNAQATATIGVRSIQPPTITAPLELCPYASGDLSVSAPAEGGAWQYVNWNVTNGYFQSDTYPYQTSYASGPNVRVFTNGQGPTTLQVYVTDSQGCNAMATATIGVRSIQPPAITAPLELCPYSGGDLSVSAPVEGGAWQYVNWNVTNGYFPSDSYPYQTSYASGPNVRVYSNGQGPTTVQVYVTDSQGCNTQATTTIGVKQLAAPPITAPASVCAGVNASASVAGTWMYVNWGISNGHFLVGGAPSQWASGPTVVFAADGSSAVTLTAYVSDDQNCNAASSTTVAVTQPVPSVAVTTLPVPVNTTDSAHIGSSYTSIQWSIVNGTIVSGANSDTLTFQADGSGPVTLTVSATDANGCSGTASAEYTIAGHAVAINAPVSFCSTTTVKTATAFSNGTLSNIQWTITNGTITAGANGPTVSFTPSSFNDVTLTLNASVDGVPASDTKVVPYALPPLNPTVSSEVTCQSRPVIITIPNYTDFAYFDGSSVNGGFIGQSNGTYQVVANTDGLPTTITLNGHTTDGCVATWTHTFRATKIPNLSFSSPAACGGASQTATVTNASDFNPSTFFWQISNGVFDTPLPPYGSQPSSVTFHATGTANVIFWISARGANDDGCGAGKQYIVPVAPAPITPTVTAGGPTTFCAGGSVTLTASAGSSYLWSNGATTQAITVNATGNYAVTVTDANGCTAASTATAVTVNPSPAATIAADGPTTFCSGGGVTLTASSGASYLWSNGVTTQSFVANGSGNYSVTVTNSSGCSTTSIPTTVTVNPLPTPSITAGGPTTFCAGGSVTLTATSGAGYLWSNGATTRAITASAGGSYSVTVTDANGCSAASASTIVTVNTAPTPVITANGPTTFCPGGSVTLTATPGTSYQWTNGATTQSITVSSSGNYKVYVTDANGCGAFSNIIAVTVNAAPAAPTISMSAPNAWCDGGAPIVLTSSPAVSYHWSTGQTTQSVSFNTAGVYHVTVTITDANGCSATSSSQSFQINTLPPSTITASGPTTFCAPGSVTLYAPVSYGPDSPYTYLWSNGATTSQITVSQSGSYTVTVKNYYGCTSTSAPTVVTASDPPKPAITADGPTQLCTTSGQTVTLRASDGASSYTWYTGEHTQSITVAHGGAYYVVATYPDGCQRTSDAFTVTEDQVLIQPSGPTNFCTGSVTLTALNNGATSFQWSTGATTQSITVSASGTYSVTATFPDGCSLTGSQTVSSSNGFSVTASPVVQFDVYGNDDPAYICPGTQMHYTAQVSGGRAPYTYQWFRVVDAYNWQLLDGQTGPSFDTAQTDTWFAVRVTDAGGCVLSSNSTRKFVYTQAHAVISALDPVPFCPGSSARLSAGLDYATSEEHPVTYQWSTGETTPQITITQPGSYTVTTTTNYGCTTTSAPFVVTTYTAPTATITAGGPTTFCAGGSVTLTAPASQFYHWSNGSGAQSITVSTSGNYTVTITDVHGCSATSQPVTVNAEALPAATISAGGATTFCAGGSVTLTASAGSSYLWSTGATTQSITVSSAGSYNVRVTDANGCSATSANQVVAVNSTPTATISGGGAYCVSGSATLTVALTGAPPFHVTYSDGYTQDLFGFQMTRTVSPAATTTYTVTSVTDANCSGGGAGSATVTVNAPPQATVTASGATTFCSGGSVTLTASSASSYLWSNGATTQAITATSSGNYSVTVTAANGCSATSTATTVTVNNTPAPSITAPSAICAGASGNASTANITGVTYAWTITNGTITSGNGTSAITFTSASGPVTLGVTVTNNSGNCSGSASATVNVNALPDATITPSGATTFCAGGSVTLSAPAGMSHYLWNNGATGQSITVYTSGTYSVTVTNASGCTTQSAVVNVTANYQPAPSITAPSTICAGASGNASTGMLAGGTVTYAWTITNGTITSGNGTNAITFTATSNPVTLGVTVTSNGICSGSASSTVNVNPPPSATITPNGPTSFCPGGSVILSAPAGMSQYAWSNGATNQSITVTTSGSFSVTVTNANGCSATSSSTVVTVNSNPAPSITAPATMCSSTSGNASTAAVSGATYAWTISGGTITSGNGTNAITFTTVFGPVSLGVTVTNNGCSGSAGATVNVNLPPSAGISTNGPTTFCQGGSVTLSGPAGMSQYAWSNGATTQSITVGTAGTYSVTVTNSNGCSAQSAGVTVAVNSNPTPSIAAPSAICSGSSGNASTAAVSGATYAWTITNGTITSGNGTNAITFTAASGPVTLGVTVTNSSSCSGTASATVNVNPPPAATISTGGPTTFCQGGSVTLSGPAGMSQYAWSNGATTQSITVGTAGTYSVTVTNANGCSATSAVITVTVNSNPAPAITAPAAICAGASGNASTAAVSGATYAWTITNGTITSGSGTNAITFTSASGPVTLGVTVMNSSNCSGTASATVNVNALPDTTITPSGATTFCTGGNVTLSAPAGMSQYAWSNGATTQSINVSTTGTYSVTVTTASGCSAQSAGVPVTVNSIPSPSISAPSAICNGATGNASTAAVSGATYAWTITNGTITSGSGTNAITFTSTSGPVTLGVTVTNNSCSGNANATVNVNAVPNATITAPAAICAGTSGSASVASVAGATYAWAITNGTITGGSGTNAITFTSSSGPASLGVTVTSNGCSATGSKSVTVNPLPNATITAPSGICNGATGTASVAAITGGTYTWSITGGTITTGSGTNAITFTSTTGPVVLSVTVSANGCSSSGSANVAVNANPAKPTITTGGPTTFCAGGSVTLTATAASGYQWSNGATTQSIVVTSAGSYTVIVTNASGCPSPASNAVTVTVNPATTITQQPASITITHNTHTTLSVTATGTGTLSYQWYNPSTPSNTDTSKKVGGNSSTFTTPNLAKGTYYYYVVVTGSCGSVSSAVATVTSN